MRVSCFHLWQPITVISPHGVERNVLKWVPCWPDLNVEVLEICEKRLEFRQLTQQNTELNSQEMWTFEKEPGRSSQGTLSTFLASDM